jgi:hypothetical protein
VQDRSRRIDYAQRSSGIRRPERITAGLGQIARTLAASGEILRFSERPEPPIIRLRFLAPYFCASGNDESLSNEQLTFSEEEETPHSTFGHRARTLQIWATVLRTSMTDTPTAAGYCDLRYKCLLRLVSDFH